MEKNAAAGRMPSSLPISTPPPLSMNASSPKIGAVSPVHTKSIGVKPDNNSGFPVPYSEDDVAATGATFKSNNNFGEDRIDRFSSAPSITTGTLDAIRERMKSIQAAAAAGNAEVGVRPLIAMNGNMQHGAEDAEGEPAAQTSALPMDEKALSGLQARMERLKNGALEPL